MKRILMTRTSLFSSVLFLLPFQWRESNRPFLSIESIMNSLTTCISAALMLAPLAAPLPVHASDCTRTSTGFTPLNEFATGEKYLSLYEGGLYPGNQNELPTSHLIRGLTEAKTIKPRAANGTVSANGRIILMSIGMSNTTQEWCAATSITQPCGATSFMAQAAELDTINFNQVTLIDGAKASQVSTQWDQPTDANYDRIRDTILTPQGLSEAQVQGVWVKVANAGPTVRLPSAGADAFAFKVHLGNIARALRVRYPNLRLMFLSNRIYAGYASSTLNPEPYAYESGFGVKWAIQAQLTQAAGGGIDAQSGDLSPSVAPHLSWGPNLWGDGMTPRADGMIWECSDFSSDGTHPAVTGRGKVGQLLVNFFAASPLCAEWYRAAPPPRGDIDNNGIVNAVDLSLLLSAWQSSEPLADIDDSGVVDGADLTIVMSDWTG